MFFAQRGRGFEQNTALDFSAWSQMVYVIVVFMITFDILFRQNPFKCKLLLVKPQRFLLYYILVCFISMFWSSNVFLTGFRAFESLTYLMLISLVIYNVVSRLSYQDIMEWAVLWIIWHLFWSVLTGINSMGFQYLLWPFQASRLAVPLFFFFALLFTKHKFFKYLILIFCVLAVSNKTYFGMALGLMGFLFGNSKYKAWIFGLAASVLLLLVFVDLEALLLKTVFYGREAVALSNTSGRDKIWEIALEGFFESPILGHGFVAGESMVLFRHFTGAINTHNFLLSGMLGTGIAGVVFLLLYFKKVFMLAISKDFPRAKWRPAMASTFIMGLIISLTAPGIGSRVYGSWIPLVLVFTLISGLYLKFRGETTRIENLKY